MQKTKIKRQNTKIPKLKYKINIITYLFCSIISVKYFAIVATSLATASDIHQGYMLFIQFILLDFEDKIYLEYFEYRRNLECLEKIENLSRMSRKDRKSIWNILNIAKI